MNQMIAQKRAMVRDQPQVDFQYFEIIPGLNAIGRTQEDEQKDQDLYHFIKNGGFPMLPAWEVCLLDNGNVGVVDCHRRHRQLSRVVHESSHGTLIELGIMNAKVNKIMIPVKVVPGDWKSMLIRVASSNTQKGLKPHQFAGIVKQLLDMGMVVAEIAKELSCSRGAVDQALLLEGAAPEVRAMVKDGTISATEVIKQVRTHKEAATDIIKTAVTKAQAKGKSKVTASAFKKKPDRPLLIAIGALNRLRTGLQPLIDSKQIMEFENVERMMEIVTTTLRDVTEADQSSKAAT